jgi:hypothetical protein
MKALSVLAVALVLVVSCAVFAERSTAKPAATDVSKIHACTELFRGGAPYPPQGKGVILNQCKWEKRVLHIKFLGGHPKVRSRVEAVAKEWEQYEPITLQFDDAADADIRIGFSAPGSWSYVGTCRRGAKDSATMNFGWLTPDTDDTEYHRVVLHEFGHALGLGHEHENPSAKIPWNEAAVIAYYKKTQNWSEKETRENVMKKYSEAETSHTRYDRDSIMEYPIPKELTDGKFEVGWNTKLSDTDKHFLRDQYK